MRGIWTELKLYLTRANSYIIIVNTGMLLFLMIGRLEDYGWEISKGGMTGIFITLMITVITIGWLDSKLGFFREESRRTADRNPYWKEVIDGTKEVNRKLDEVLEIERRRSQRK